MTSVFTTKVRKYMKLRNFEFIMINISIKFRLIQNADTNSVMKER